MKIHIVKKGETLQQIADKYHIDLQTLLEANPIIANPDDIDVGLKVKIPASVTPVHGSKDKAPEKKDVQYPPCDKPANKDLFKTQKPSTTKVGSFYDIPSIPEIEESWGKPYSMPYADIPGLTPAQVMATTSPAMMPPPPKLAVTMPCAPYDVPVHAPYQAMYGGQCEPVHMPYSPIHMPFMHSPIPCGTPISPYPLSYPPYPTGSGYDATSHSCACARNQSEQQKKETESIDTDPSDRPIAKTKSKQSKKGVKKGTKPREQYSWINP